MNLYEPPATKVESERHSKMNEPTKLGYFLAVLGLLLYGISLFGFLAGVVRVMDDFAGVRVEPSEMAQRFSVTLLTFFWSFIFAIPSVYLVLKVNERGWMRKVWFYKGAVTLSAIWMLLIPLGTIIGSVCMFAMTRKKKLYFPLSEKTED